MDRYMDKLLVERLAFLVMLIWLCLAQTNGVSYAATQSYDHEHQASAISTYDGSHDLVYSLEGPKQVHQKSSDRSILNQVFKWKLRKDDHCVNLRIEKSFFHLLLYRSECLFRTGMIYHAQIGDPPA